MIGFSQSPDRSVLRSVFYGPLELRAGWRLCIFLAIVSALVYASNLAVRRVLHGADDTTLFLVRELTDFLIFLLASWVMGRIEDRTIANYGLPWRKLLRAQFWQGASIGFASLTALLLVMRLCGLFYFGTVALHSVDAWKWAAVYALVFMLVSLREEFRARGYPLFTLAAGIGFWPAAILSSAFFGYSHHGNTGEDWIGLFNAGLFGLLACFLLQRTGNLWMPIGVHMGFDWGETYFYGVADSGQVLPGHLLNSSSSGRAWLSGGTVGPEGSVLCTLLILLLWSICAMWLREVKYPPPVSTEFRRLTALT
jgi:membrane protease YdiL (CAAX protease family)